jgi:methionine-rich copper-binding protein CopC
LIFLNGMKPLSNAVRKKRIRASITVYVALITFLLGLTRALAQPTIVSTVPAAGATGVSTNAAVVFTFSEAMDPTATTATFLNDSTFALLTTSPVWSAGNTVLSCTPSPAFPAGTSIRWVVSGQNPGGTSLGGVPTATFTTSGGGGGGGGGSGTNKYTSFSVGQAIYYDQTSAGAPTADTNISYTYIFVGEIILSSNRTATSATLKLPSGSVSNLFENPFAPEEFFLDAGDTNQTRLDATFGSGNYMFTVVSADSNQQVTIDLPASLVQPAAPHITSYTAAQSVNPAQSFTLKWDAFAGATAADVVYVSIGAFNTSMPGTSNALAGTATSLEIPAGTLQPNSNYDSSITFYRLNSATNHGDHMLAFRDSVTVFTLITTGGATTPVILTDASWSGHTFSFNVTSAVGQSLIIQYNTSGALLSSQWQTLLTTNSATGVVQVSDSLNTGGSHVMYRAQTGP